MVASGEDGIVAVGGADHLYHYNLLTTINDSLQLGKLGKRKNAPNGDHWYITQKGVKAVIFRAFEAYSIPFLP